jgi:hypothetical protein
MNEAFSHAAAVIAGLVARDVYERGKHYLGHSVGRRRPDFQALQSGWYGSSWPSDGIFVTLKCAPARPRPPRQVNVGAAVRFTADHYPEFDPQPRYSAPDGTDFGWAGDDLRLRSTCSLWMRANGLLELRLPLPFEVADDGAAEVSLDHISGEALYFIDVTRAGYQGVFGRTRRVNWYVNLGGALMIDGSSRHWRPTFHGPKPGGRARETHPSQNPRGYGGKALIDRPLRGDPVCLVRAVIDDFLTCTGHHDFAAAAQAAMIGGAAAAAQRRLRAG